VGFAMPYVELLWTPQNIAHIAEHGINQQEVEDVLSEPVGEGVSRSSRKRIVFGFTRAGRKLAVVCQMVDRITIYPITAYDVED